MAGLQGCSLLTASHQWPEIQQESRTQRLQATDHDHSSLKPSCPMIASESQTHCYDSNHTCKFCRFTALPTDCRKQRHLVATSSPPLDGGAAPLAAAEDDAWAVSVSPRSHFAHPRQAQQRSSHASRIVPAVTQLLACDGHHQQPLLETYQPAAKPKFCCLQQLGNCI